MSDAAKLFELQKVDIAWEKVRRRLQQIQKSLGETEELRAARAQAAETESNLSAWRGKQRDAELESRTLAEKIQSTERRLMSGEVRNPKELETLQSSLEALRRHRTAVDDSAVEAMMHADELAKLLNEHQASLAELESAWSNGQTDLREEETKMKQNFVLLKRRREQLAAELNGALLDRYEHLRKRKGGIAIAPLQNGSCSACHVKAPTGVVSAVKSSGNNALVMCTSCGRILFAI
jgi:predicted  nucleic acid-binding Zn-ribbon protein